MWKKRYKERKKEIKKETEKKEKVLVSGKNNTNKILRKRTRKQEEEDKLWISCEKFAMTTNTEK